MSALGVETTRRGVGEQGTTAGVNGVVVEVHQTHRRWSAADYVPGAVEALECEPVVVTVAVSVGLALEDVVAVLFHWGVPYEELADDHTVRELIAETVVNGGCHQLEELRCHLGERGMRDAGDAGYLAYCQERAAAVFGVRPCAGGGAVGCVGGGGLR